MAKTTKKTPAKKGARKAPKKKAAAKSSKKSTKKNTAKKQKGFVRRVLLPIFFFLALVALIILAIFMWQLDRQVVDKFAGKKWSVPARVYARPLELYEGLRIDAEHVLKEAQALGYKDKKGLPGSVVKEGSRMRIYTRGFNFQDGKEPAYHAKISFSGNTVKSIKTVDGEPIPLLRFEPMIIGAIYPDHKEDRLLLNIDEVPKGLIDTLLAVEDRNFYQHHGISIRGTVRALVANMRNQKLTQGGSTLTQQLVKNFFLTSERTYKRKAKEALMAIIMELRFSKEEILQAYLNEIYLGQNKDKAIHGFGVASYYYFDKPVEALDLHEYALLVGIVKGPSSYDPKRRKERSVNRRNQVLDILLEQNIISKEEHKVARDKALTLGKGRSGLKRSYPAYLDLVQRQLKREYKEKDLKNEGLKIFTNFDPQVQWNAEAAIKKSVARMEKRIRKDDREQFQAATVVTNPINGEVLAIVGDKKAEYFGFNRALDAKRQIGSLIKPGVYLAALEQKDKFTLASILDDSEISMVSGGKRWEPKNFDKKEHGDVMLYRSLALSYNLSTIRLGQDAGLGNVVDTLKRLGVEQEVPEVPAMLLGSVDMSPYEVAQMYQTIASNGFYTPLRAIRGVLDQGNQPLKAYPLEIEQRFDSDLMYLLQFAMYEVVRAGTAKKVYNVISDKIELAGKTGTSNEQRDSWFAGFAANRLAVVWVGRDDNKPTPYSGGSGALPTWIEIMKTIQPRSLALAEPEGVESYWINAVNGTLTRQHCSNAITLPFLKDSQPEALSACISSSKTRRVNNAREELQRKLQDEENEVLDWMSRMVQ